MSELKELKEFISENGFDNFHTDLRTEKNDKTEIIITISGPYSEKSFSIEYEEFLTAMREVDKKI